jgi:hypothetical protein
METPEAMIERRRVEDRVAALESNHAALERRIGELDKKVDANTEITNSIKADTSQIVALFKASQLGATVVKWCATVGGGLIVAYAAVKGLRN